MRKIEIGLIMRATASYGGGPQPGQEKTGGLQPFAGDAASRTGAFHLAGRRMAKTLSVVTIAERKGLPRSRSSRRRRSLVKPRYFSVVADDLWCRRADTVRRAAS